MNAPWDEAGVRRELHLRIARARRRIDGRLRRIEREGIRLISWRTYVRRYPAQSLAASCGIGLVVSAGLRRSLPRYMGMRLLRYAGGAVFRFALQELSQWSGRQRH